MQTGLTDAPSRLEIYVCGPQPCLPYCTPAPTLTLTAPSPAEHQLPFFFLSFFPLPFSIQLAALPPQKCQTHNHPMLFFWFFKLPLNSTHICLQSSTSFLRSQRGSKIRTGDPANFPLLSLCRNHFRLPRLARPVASCPGCIGAKSMLPVLNAIPSTFLDAALLILENNNNNNNNINECHEVLRKCPLLPPW